MSPKHLHRYVNEFADRHNVRSLDTLDQMKLLAKSMVGKRRCSGCMTGNGLRNSRTQSGEWTLGAADVGQGRN